MTAAALLLVSATALHGEKRLSRTELTNFALGPEYSQWLLGPIAQIATKGEIEEYLGLSTDEDASAFVEAFWLRRAEGESAWPIEQPQAVFEARAAEADRLFTEGVRLGRRTDRGEIHILYGRASEVRFDSNPDIWPGPIEVWEYGKESAKGLDGKRPKQAYRFVRDGEVTVFLKAAKARPRDPRRRRMR